jgi:PleD family two-component response regulator
LYLGNDLELISALKKALPKLDYRLVSRSDRESAVMFLKSDIPYQLLLIDFEWRQREGLKSASLARLLKHRKRMPTTTTELRRRLKVLARNAGVNECVSKTPDMGAIIETIQRLTDGLIGSAN